MSKRIYEAEAPNGQKLIRTTRSCFYTHAVIARHSLNWTLNNTVSLHVDDAQTYFDRIRRYQHELFGATTGEEYRVAYEANRRAEIEKQRLAGHFDNWFLVSCVSRPELGPKRLREYSRWNTYEEILLVPVTLRS